MSNKCCIKDNEDACYHSNIPITCNMDKCNDDLIHNGKFCCSGEAEFNGGKYLCKTKTPPPPPKRTCANPGEDVYTPNKFTRTPAPCCDGKTAKNDGTGKIRCPKTPPPPKRTCANPGEDVTKSNIFKTIPAPCCDRQKPVNNICPDTPPPPPPPPGNSGGNKMGLKVLLGILIFLWFVTLGVFIYTKYKIGK